MSKKILWDYIDACELIKETEEDIRRLRKGETVHDKVSGSNRNSLTRHRVLAYRG